MVALALSLSANGPSAQSLAERNAALLQKLQRVHKLSAAQLGQIRGIFKKSGIIGQGNPAITKHPITEAACRQKRSASAAANSRFTSICGAPFMAPLYDPATERPEDARACIDQYEFPDVPCTYPVVWTKASEAAAICGAMGKRLCDAHEWEGACQGSLGPPDYRFDLAKGLDANSAVNRMRAAHNAKYASTQRWSYGPAYKRGVCGAASRKSSTCNGGSYRGCGSNTYPTGSFSACVSPLGVFDLNGNAAEHMNLPLAPDQMASRGSKKLGVTEMKGSWFIFDSYRAHPDWCRWRAPFWHGARVKSAASHDNYHLGFRCCKTLQ